MKQISFPEENITISPFYIAYMDFKKRLDIEKLTESEWENIFNPKREKSTIRHPEDFK